MFLEILFTLCLNAPKTSANERDIHVKIQSIHSLPLLFDLELSKFHFALCLTHCICTEVETAVPILLFNLQHTISKSNTGWMC